MATQVAYQCSADGAFIAETRVQEDIFAPGSFLLPANCTLAAPPSFNSLTQRAIYADGTWKIEPMAVAPEPQPVAGLGVATEANKPDAGANQIAIIVDGQWQLAADYRGTTYWLADGTEHHIRAIGETVPSDSLSSPPVPPEPALPTLDEARTMQIALLRSAYQAAIQQPVSFTTAAGHTDTFAADTSGVNNLEAMLTAYAAIQSFPLNLWLNDSGLPVTPFVYADLQGLAQAIADQATPDYQELLSKISAVMVAETVAAVHAVIW